MRWIALIAFVLFVPLASLSQTPPSQPLGAGRPETPGITRTTLKDDAKSTVTRVHFEPGAAEPPHTHPYDVILVPVITGPTAGDPAVLANETFFTNRGAGGLPIALP